MKTPDLKPCPFCGSDVYFTTMYVGNAGEEHCIACEGCDMLFTIDWLSPEKGDLAEMWTGGRTMKLFDDFEWEYAIQAALVILVIFLVIFPVALACVYENVWFLLMWLLIVPIVAFVAGKGWLDE